LFSVVLTTIRFDFTVHHFNALGWSIETKKRKSGKVNGKRDRFYVSPEGKKYRTKEQMKKVDDLLNGKTLLKAI
jgi:hypothetical protein